MLFEIFGIKYIKWSDDSDHFLYFKKAKNVIKLLYIIQRVRMNIEDPKHKVNRLIKLGKFKNIKLKDHSQLMITYHALKEKNNDAYFELSDHYFIIYDGKTLTAYSI